MDIVSYWNKTAEVNSEGHTLRDCRFMWMLSQSQRRFLLSNFEEDCLTDLEEDQQEQWRMRI